MTPFRHLGNLLLLLLCCACGTGERSISGTPDAAPAPLNTAPVQSAAFPVSAAPQPEINIPAGTVLVGSAPSTPHRFPQHEADLVPVQVPAFSIDRLPYPNDPSRPPMTGVNRDEAADLCAQAGKRLCHELEWERACRGDSDNAYAPGEQFDLEECSISPERCSSPVGVLGLGVIAREWTASETGNAFSVAGGIARGGHSESPTHEHRCGFRRALLTGTNSEFVGFRCCSGSAPTDLEYPSEPERPNLVQQEVSTEELRSILATVPALARFAPEFQTFSPEAMHAVLNPEESTGATPPLGAWRTPEQNVLIWSPLRGEELWVLAGHTREDAIIVVLHTTHTGGFEHAASFIFNGDSDPVALAHFSGRPDELAWSKCWGCGGEGGVIEYDRPKRRVRIVPR